MLLDVETIPYNQLSRLYRYIFPNENFLLLYAAEENMPTY